ncbi:universal stress protein [Paenibacillus protaetiae]|uniref:Universal stress protein n=1 Tax=Paenibacillus protaetiae TaxID=2509456 RepID=A0A4P6EY79_9BACL|nr:universal stress protein [Paenibacillus protaetiae]QAY66729.1 universal stress protein [Paenibacillus protaetiae]
MNKFLLATDGSDDSKKAVVSARKMLEAFPKATLTAVYVTDNLTTLPPGMIIPQEMDEAEKNYVSELEKKLFAELKGLEDRVTFLNAKGNPVQTICRIADKEKADLIIIGSHGRGAINRLLIGSVSHGVLHHTAIPVLVAR